MIIEDQVEPLGRVPLPEKSRGGSRLPGDGLVQEEGQGLLDIAEGDEEVELFPGLLVIGEHLLLERVLREEAERADIWWYP